MTIKVCHQKFRDRMNKLENILIKIVWGIYYSIQIIFPASVVYGLYTWGMGDFFGSLFVLIGGLMTFFLYFWIVIDGSENIFSKINRKLKLFEWRNDC